MERLETPAAWQDDDIDARGDHMFSLQFCPTAYLELVIPAYPKFLPKVRIVSNEKQQELTNINLARTNPDAVDDIQHEALRASLEWLRQAAADYTRLAQAACHALVIAEKARGDHHA